MKWFVVILGLMMLPAFMHAAEKREALLQVGDQQGAIYDAGDSDDYDAPPRRRVSPCCCFKTPCRMAVTFSALSGVIAAVIGVALAFGNAQQTECPATHCITAKTDMTNTCFDVRICGQDGWQLAGAYPPYKRNVTGKNILNSPLTALAREQNQAVCVTRLSCSGTPYEQ